MDEHSNHLDSANFIHKKEKVGKYFNVRKTWVLFPNISIAADFLSTIVLIKFQVFVDNVCYWNAFVIFVDVENCVRMNNKDSFYGCNMLQPILSI